MSELQHLPAQVRGFLDLTGAHVPIVQAPIGSGATPTLVGQVTRAGGLGGLALTWTAPGDITGTVEAARKAAGHGRFFGNFVLHFPCEGFDAALEAGLPVVTLSWGIDADRVLRAQRAGALVGIQVGNRTGARLACDAGADFLIAQGVEAGGHVQSTTPLHILLPQVLDEAAGLPVIAAGGIAGGAAIARAIQDGAAGAMMGTRFVASVESGYHDGYKAALVAASGEDTAFTNCFDVGWPFAMHRVLRNDTFNIWEAAGSARSPGRPGEGDIVYRGGGEAFVRYSDTPPMRDAKGALGSACLYAGTGVAQIRAVEPAGAIVARLWAEAQESLFLAAAEGMPS